jgi:two-component sensor histidine kinase
LTDALLRIHRRPEITASFDVEPLLLSIDKATPLGLVANELLTNALKHAFPAGRTGEIRVKLRRATDGQSALTITDNGIGTEMMAFPSSNGLGSQLIQLLATSCKRRSSLIAALALQRRCGSNRERYPASVRAATDNVGGAAGVISCMPLQFHTRL